MDRTVTKESGIKREGMTLPRCYILGQPTHLEVLLLCQMPSMVAPGSSCLALAALLWGSHSKVLLLLDLLLEVLLMS